MIISQTNKILYFLLSFTIFIGLYIGEDSAGSGGFTGDFIQTLVLVKDPFQGEMFGAGNLIDMKFPLHYYVASIIYFLLENDFYLRFVYVTISIVCPYIFYLCLKEKYKNIDANNLFIFSLTIFLLPTFRSSAIWANTQITAIIFFLLALYFFTKWQFKKNINLDLFFFYFLCHVLFTRGRSIHCLICFLFIIFIKNLDLLILLKPV